MSVRQVSQMRQKQQVVVASRLVLWLLGRRHSKLRHFDQPTNQMSRLECAIEINILIYSS